MLCHLNQLCNIALVWVFEKSRKQIFSFTPTIPEKNVCHHELLSCENVFLQTRIMKVNFMYKWKLKKTALQKITCTANRAWSDDVKVAFEICQHLKFKNNFSNSKKIFFFTLLPHGLMIVTPAIGKICPCYFEIFYTCSFWSPTIREINRKELRRLILLR